MYHTRFIVQPNQSGRLKERSGSICLPRAQFTAIGIPYEMSSSTTDAETIALKALGGISIVGKMEATYLLP